MKTFLNGITLEVFASFINGKIYMNNADPETKLSYICTDSREVEDSSVFVAIVGERTDGHKYIDVATDKNAALVICEHLPEKTAPACAYAVVENSEKALLFAAHEYRKRFCESLRAVAVTGSVGKTTSKEIIYAALSGKLDVYKTDGNFNSVIGMPISLLGMESRYSHAVYEMGMSALGEIRSMSSTLMPYVGVITNVGHSHLEYLKTRENILRAKLEITEGIADDGYLVINADDEMLSKVDYSKYAFTTVRCSTEDENADYYAFNIRFGDNNSMIFDYRHNGITYTGIEVAGVGAHLVRTALSAIAVGEILGLTPEECAAGFSCYKNAAMRQNIISVGKITVIEDCYNAAPESMRAAIDALMKIKQNRSKGKAVAFLGDMKELGENTEALHTALGEYLAHTGVDTLITFGELSRNIANGAVNAGLSPQSVYSLEDIDEESTGALLNEILEENDILLVKASRSMRGERVTEILKRLFKAV